MNIYEVKGITANLASVGSTCHYMRTALIFTKDSVYIAPEEILIPDQVKVGTYNVEKGLYEVDDNFLEHNSYERCFWNLPDFWIGVKSQNTLRYFN